MDALVLLASALLPWGAGTAMLVALRERSRTLSAPGEIAWAVGAGYLVGAFVLTLWMRALALVDVPFGRVAIGAPMLLIAVGGGWLAWRRDGTALFGVPWRRLRAAIAVADVHRVVAIAAWVIVATIALRFALLLLEVVWRPLYPWDAWTQWATKARVWYELGHLAPFVSADAWLAGNGVAYFDAAPGNPPTMPLLQVWTCVALGRWDDALMNLPWWLVAVALTFAVAGSLRRLGTPRGYSLAGAYLVSSLPLANAHVALAGYGDLPLAACYCAAVLALLHWHVTRHRSDGALALLFAVACTQVHVAGLAWALTLVPGIAVALLPTRGVRVVAIAAGCAVLALAVLARTSPVVAGHAWHIEFDPAWASLGEGVFLLGSWNLLWYGVIGATLLAGRRLVAPPLAPLAVLFATASLLFLAMAMFPALATEFAGPITTNRLLLHLAPLATTYLILAYRAFATRGVVSTGAAAIAAEIAPDAT